jgi:hypothetical protein
MRKKLGTIILHSTIDVITNSSSELFCTVEGEKEAIENILKEVVNEMGCTAVDISLYEYYDDNDEIVQGRWSVHYDYEMHHEPCKAMLNSIKEKLNIID